MVRIDDGDPPSLAPAGGSMSNRFSYPVATPAERASRRRTSRLLAGATVAALIAGAAFAAPPQGFAATPLFSPQTSAGARAPATPAAIPGFADLVAAVKPAVVSVRVKAKAEQAAFDGATGDNPFEGTPLEKFFQQRPDGQGSPFGRRFGQRQPGAPGGVRMGQGSGFFVSADGYVVTNNHVVDKASSVEIVTDSGETLKAKVVGTDAKTDLALLKVDGRADLPFVKLSTEQPRIGEWVVAMGNPFGLGGSVTAGIVSAQGRDIGSGPYDDYIQIDAPVNRGNSGGPTFNLKGEVIGVNTAIYSPSGGSVGIAFDIPASTVASVIPQLQEGGTVARGWLGVQIQPVTAQIAESVGLKEAAGALIAEPRPGSPAAKAGLKAGDVVTGVDAIQIKDPRALARTIAALGPDKSVTLHLWRDGKAQSVPMTLGRLADQPVRKASAEDQGGGLDGLGLSVQPGKQGLAVVGVDPEGKAAELGVREGDVIVKAGGKPVASADDLAAAMAQSKAEGRKSTLVLVKRDKADVFVALPNIG
jgi:serine protease Do